MRLYHGTNAKNLPTILKDGLQPRGKKRKGNWQHSVLSSPDAIYLTNAYAIYFAWTATKDGDDMLVLEIDTNKMSSLKLVPDEDFLEQATRTDGPAPLGKSMKYRTGWYRRRLLEFHQHWQDSIEHLGTCAYMGPISPEAITRYAVIPGERASELVMFGMDPTISLLNYRFCGPKYRNWTNWLFYMPYEEDPLDSAISQTDLPRDGITIVERKPA